MKQMFFSLLLVFSFICAPAIAAGSSPDDHPAHTSASAAASVTGPLQLADRTDKTTRRIGRHATRHLSQFGDLDGENNDFVKRCPCAWAQDIWSFVAYWLRISA